jgi:TRAP-type mannitol/chloroaromatic compound transport system substrate-binding protein
MSMHMVQAFLACKKPVQTIDELKGMKIRATGLFTKVPRN